MDGSFYGYCDYRNMQNSCVIITQPCTTRLEAESAFKRAFRNFPKALRIDMWGRQHGVVHMKDDNILIPPGKLGIRIYLNNTKLDPLNS